PRDLESLFQNRRDHPLRAAVRIDDEAIRTEGAAPDARETFVSKLLLRLAPLHELARRLDPLLPGRESVTVTLGGKSVAETFRARRGCRAGRGLVRTADREDPGRLAPALLQRG